MQSSGGFEINRNRDRAREVQGRGRFGGTFELSAGKRTLPDAGGQAELICDPQKKSQASLYLREHVVVLLPAQFAGTWGKQKKIREELGTFGASRTHPHSLPGSPTGPSFK
jgi:hypothetical protein